jgi:hypothetical protein
VAEAQVAAGTRWTTAAAELDSWMRRRDYAGYDPHDWLSSGTVRALSFGSRWLGAAWTQVGKRAPVQLRPLVGVRPARNAKGIGLTLAAHADLYLATGDEAYIRSAGELVEWLAGSAVVHGGGVGWGYPFPWSNRDFHAPAGTPASVPTAFIAHALLDAAERVPAAPWAPRAGELAVTAGRFLHDGLNRIPQGHGFAFSYTPVDQRAVHNASMLTASVLARLAGGGAGAWRGDAAPSTAERDRWAESVMGALQWTLSAQRADGSWPYGAARKDAWVDSFHTSYLLVCLDLVGRSLGEEFPVATPVDDGLRYWRRTFLAGPAVTFHAGEPYPIDTHAVAHAIITLVELEHRIPDALAEAERLAGWCVREMRDGEGYFYYQKHRFHTNRLAYMRWTQAWMLLALARLGARMSA